MKILNLLEVQSGKETKRIELLSGDLTEIPPEHAVDALILSAFPGDYTPTEGSLIGALERKGLSVAKLAKKPEQDLTRDFSCWLSQPIDQDRQRLRFKRILCFEPLRKGRPSEVVDDIFRALAPVTFAEPRIRSIAMPLLAAGDQEQPEAEMLEALLTAAHRWLSEGFPLDTIKVVVYDRRPSNQVQAHFREVAAALQPQLGFHAPPENVLSVDLAANAPRPIQYDVFISYSRVDGTAASFLYEQLVRAGLTVFMDRSAIGAGASWLQNIFDALATCRLTVTLYSPDFVKSKACQDEFNISWIKRYDTNRDALFPLLIRDATMPPHMRMLNYVDCRTNDEGKIADAAAKLAALITAQGGVSLQREN